MPSYVPSKSREPLTLPFAVPSTSSEPSSARSIGCTTIQVQRAVELDFVHAIRGNYTVVHAIKVNRAFDVAICYSAFEVNEAIGCSIGCASESEPSNLPLLTKSDSSLPSSRPSSVLSKLGKPRRSHVLCHQRKASPRMFHQLYHPSPMSRQACLCQSQGSRLPRHPLCHQSEAILRCCQ
jgi:hypothetical protein